MAGLTPGPGQQPMTSGQQSALASALQSVSPPSNPKTPFQRTDPQHTWLIGLQRVRTSFRDLNDNLDDKDDITVGLIIAMQVATERLLAGVPPNEVALLSAASMIKTVNPMLASQIEQQWASINRPPQVAGAPMQTGPTPQPGAGMGPATPPPGMNPGIATAMMGGAGSQPAA